MPKTKQTPKVDPISFSNRAREFYTAAEQVFGQQGSSALSWPLYFLYFHTLELAFKAFLRSHGFSTAQLLKKRHQLSKLYEDCRQLGLVIGPRDKFEIGNVVTLLEGANKFQGLRYFNPDLSSLPSLAWTREVAQELIRTIELHLGVGPKLVPGPATGLVFVWDKPRPKS